MKPLFIFCVFLLAICKGHAQQQNQPLDSFFNFYCDVFKGTYTDKSNNNIMVTLDKTAQISFTPTIRKVVLEAKNAVKKKYNLTDDYKAVDKLAEINTNRFLNTKFFELTDPAIFSKYDSIYKVYTKSFCTCLTGRLKGLNREQTLRNKTKIMQDCISNVAETPEGKGLLPFMAQMTMDEEHEWNDNRVIYVYSHCDILRQDLISLQQIRAQEQYRIYYGLQTANLRNSIEAFAKKGEGNTDSLKQLFANSTDFEKCVNQIKGYVAAYKARKFYKMVNYNHYPAKINEDSRVYLSKTGDKYDIAFMITYVFTPGMDDRKLIGFRFLEGNQMPEKQKILKELTEVKEEFAAPPPPKEYR